MDDLERQVIQDHYAQLKRELAPGLADELYSKKVISRERLDEIDAIDIQSKRNGMVLKALEDSPNKDAFSLFLTCMKETDDVMMPIVTKLREALQAAKTPKPVACSDDVAAMEGGVFPSDPSKLRSSDKPSLIRCQELGVVSKLASEWYTFAVYLGLEEEADQIDHNYRFVQEKCKQVIALWLKGSGKKHSKDPITWETLRSVIEKIYPAFAEELAEEIN